MIPQQKMDSLFEGIVQNLPEARRAFTNNIREELEKNSGRIDPYDFGMGFGAGMIFASLLILIIVFLCR